MKKLFIHSIFLLISGFVLMTQAPAAPPSSANEGGGPVCGGAPIGEGTVLLITLAAGYGGKMVYDFRNPKQAK